LVVVIVAVTVPVTLKVYKGRRQTVFQEVTAAPTDVPSMVPSELPSSQPSSIRFTAIVRKLEGLSGDALRRQGSPQYLAAMWMADDDPYPNLRTGGAGMDLSDGGFEQRYVMALFYYAMDGANWANRQGWLGKESMCEWYGIKGESDGCPGGGVLRSHLVSKNN
jgi:hypothetical protein